ncbi:MAG TPA: Xaa-Pro peptidase family protein [Solirubrobacteraceae bacterium]|nr:Xaa-Pro peptidase family protein [Solirubrobacteraceae bacterium]
MTRSDSIRPELARDERLAHELREHEVDALLVETSINLRYLTGFTGSHGLAVLVAGDRAEDETLGVHRFITDFRYATQSREQVPETFERQIVAGELLDAAVGSLPGRRGRLGFDDATLSVARHRKLTELLPEGWQLVPLAGAVERLRAVKEPGEVARIRAACELADEALRLVLEAGVVGRTERDVAIELELQMRRLGAQAPSFPSIVAAGAHAALPHAEPRDEEIPPDVLLTIDWGALSDGYCSDCTRTFATGDAIPDEAREIYALVLRAQERGLAAVEAGPNGREVDAVAREVIEQAGQGENFGHGLGHGVGMDIHEGPRLSRTAGEEPLLAGNVVSIEPGVYLPGRLGVRIEDLVVVQEDGCEVLTSLPKSLTVIS